MLKVDTKKFLVSKYLKKKLWQKTTTMVFEQKVNELCVQKIKKPSYLAFKTSLNSKMQKSLLIKYNKNMKIH